MTDQFYGEESIKIKQTAKTGWVQSEFRKQEKYRRNYYGTIFLEILLEKCSGKRMSSTLSQSGHRGLCG